MNTATTSRRAAFTLIEVLIVVTIIGLASAVIVPHMLSAGTLGVQSATRIVVADMMFAQNDAMAQQAGRQIMFDVAGNGYRLADAGGTTLSADWMGGVSENYAVDFDDDARFAGVAIRSADFGGDAVIQFDDLGAPDSGGTVELEFNDHRFRITVAEFTGRITVDRVTEGG